MEYIEAEVIESHNDLDILISKNNKKKSIYRIIFGSLVFTWIFLIVLYFILPKYRVESIEIKGLNILEKDDIIYLSKYDKNKHIINIDKRDLDTNLLNKSENIIIECNSQADIFNLKVDIIEDMPIFNYNERLYFLSLCDKEEYLNHINNCLPRESYYKISSKINKIAENDLIQLHFNKVFNKGLESEKEVNKIIDLFKGIDLESVSYIDDIQFTSYFDSLNTYSLLDAIISSGADKFVIKSIRYDTILDVFNSPNTIKNIINSATSMKNKLNKINYHFLDSEVVYNDIYELHVTVNNHHVRIYTI